MRTKPIGVVAQTILLVLSSLGSSTWALTNEEAKFEVPGAASAGKGAAVGWTVGVSGETAVVGAPGDNNPNNPAGPAGHLSGSAAVFVRTGATWSLQTMLFPSDLALDDHFGRSVAIEGDTLVAGSIYDDDGGTDVGSAYVFERSGTTWTEVAKLVPSTAPADSFFGMGIALSGDTIVVGAPSKFFGTGEAFVFTRPPSGWSGTLNEQARLTPSDLTANERQFGWAVAASGDTVLVGAYRANDNGVISGAAYVFEEPPSGWADMTETAKLMPSDPASDANFGESVALFGDTALVGAPTDGTGAGAAYFFTRPGAGWAGTLNEDSKLTPSDGSAGDFFGESVALSGARAVIGAPHADDFDPPPPRIGAAYLFVNNGTSWIEEAKYVASDSQDRDQFGKSAAVSGGLAIVGAHRDRVGPSNEIIGSAYAFDADLAGIPGVTISKRTNGAEADSPDDLDVPIVPAGDAVLWSYEITNTGNVPVDEAEVLVTDSQPGVNPIFDSVVVGNADTILDPGEIWLYEAAGTAIDTASPPPGVTVVANVCTAGGVAPASPAYTNLGTVAIPGTSASDSSSYCNPLPAVDIEKATNAVDADDPADGTAPQIAIGNPVNWSYAVTNTGNVRLVSVAVTDDHGVTVTCPQSTLEVAEMMTCSAAGLAEDLDTTAFTTVLGTCGGIASQLLYENMGTVTALSEAAIPVTDIDPSHYCNPFEGPAVGLEKTTNGIDADDPNDGTAPQIAIGDPVTWSYAVSNIGTVRLVNVDVTDDQGLAVSCPQTTLEVGESMTCTAADLAEDLGTTVFTTVLGTCGGVANQLLYENIGTVNAESEAAEPASDADPSHYCNSVPAAGGWPFDEGAGTLAADEAGTSDGTVIGATWVPGVSGTALEFDGINDHVAIANTAALDITGTQITMAGWIYPHDGGTAGGSRVISKRTDAGGSDVYSMYTYQSRLRFRLDGQDMISAHVFALNQWLHVAMVYDGVDKRIYVDGVLDAATPQLKSDPINASTRAVHLGMREAEARRYNGLLDEVRIYDTALSAAEVAELAGLNQPPVVDAGPDVTLRLPVSSVALDATVTDDGLPIATPVTTWSQLSGPAGVSFGNANAVDTTATFPGVGTYGLQLTADDTEFQSSDQLTVIVEAAPALATIVVTPDGVSLNPAQTQQYNTVGFDQYGDPFPVAPSWSATGGTITPLALYTAGSVGGTFAVTAQDGPISDSATVTITLSPPTAEAGGPYAGDEGSGIPVDGSGSTDPDNDIVAWDWDFDGDGNYDDASGETVTFTSFDSGAFVIGLRVTDGDGATNADTATVTVDNVTPTAVASGPYSGDQDTNIALDGSSSSDPGNDIVTYEWDLDNDAQFDDASGVTTVFAAAAPGVFTIGLRVTDADGAAATDMATVTVLDTVPAAPLGLAATGSDAQVDLNWNDSPETDLAGYRVYRATASGGPYTSITGLLTASDHQDTIVTNDVTYHYVVTAEDAAGNESINSAEVAATPSAGDPSLRGHWPLDEGSGTLAADEAGTSDGTVIGATWVPGVSGTALEFDGINDHVAIANTAALDITGTQITMAGWIYPHDGGTAGGSRVISKRTDAGGSDVYSMYTYQSRLRFRLDGQDMISAHVFALNQWLHVAMVYDGVDKRIYVDGVLDAATPQLKSDPINASTRAVHLGMREAEARRYNGLLDEVGIYDRALTAAEVAELAGLAGLNQPPVVDAGPDVTLRLPANSVVLDATVTDDGLPIATPVTTWSQLSGPAGVSLGNANAVDTTATFPGVGTYGLQLTADDTEFQSSDLLTVTVEAAPALATIVVTPEGASLSPAQTQQYNTAGFDQYGDPFPVAPSWSATGGTITPLGLYTAGSVAGTFAVTAQDGPVSDSATVSITLSPPTAEAGGPYAGDEGSSIPIDGSGSTDPDNDIVAWDWDLDGNGGYDDASGETITFTSFDSGVFIIGLRVTDGDGATDTDTTTVTVDNVTPTAEAGGTYSGDQGSDIPLDGSGSNDPGNDILTYEWDLDNDTQFDDASGVTTVFAGTAPGVFTIGLRVTDADSAAATDMATVTVLDTAPAAPLGLGATGSDAQIDLDWDDSPETDLAGYRVYRATVSGGSFTDITGLLTASDHQDTAVTNDVTYYYVVTAEDAAGNESINSAEVAATPTGGGSIFNEEAKFEVPGAASAGKGAAVGWTVGVSGETAVVGAPGDNNPNNPAGPAGHLSGSAAVFVRTGATWSLQTMLFPSDLALDDHFGRSVAIEGDTLVAGSIYDDDGGTDVGSAYVFERSGTTWTEVAKLVPSTAPADSFFGMGIALSGDTIVVGAPSKFFGTGEAFVFTRPPSGWSGTLNEQARLTPSDLTANERQFGWAVAASGDTVLVGAYRANDNGVISGAAYVFEEPPSGWADMTETAKLMPSDPASDANFGESVALFGDTALVGAPTDGTGAGAAYFFTRPGAGWAGTLNEDSKLTPSDGSAGDFFGESVALSGARAVIGAPHADDFDPPPPRIGAAYLFVNNGTSWIEEAKYVASDSQDRDQFGKSAAVSGGLAIVGAHRDRVGPSNEIIGSAYAFDADLAGIPGVTISKRTNGAEADSPDDLDVPIVPAGDAVLWSYEITNTGNVPVDEAEVLVTDSQPGVNPIFDSVVVGNADTILDPGEIWLYEAAGTAIDIASPPPGVTVVANVCTAGGVAPASPAYTNLGTVAIPGTSASDSSSYCNPLPALDIEKATNGIGADDPADGTAPQIMIGDPVNWSYAVMNTGNVRLVSVAVTDDQGVAVSCPKSTLEVAEMMICSAGGLAEDLATTAFTTVLGTCGGIVGQPLYENFGIVTALSETGVAAGDTDPSHYCNPFEGPVVGLEKTTNGIDADDPNDGTAPQIAIGDPVTWSYAVSNIGTVRLVNVAVTDDQGLAVSCPQTTLEVGESMTCTAADLAEDLGTTGFTTVPGTCGGAANELLYENIGTVNAESEVAEPASDADPSHYCNSVPAAGGWPFDEGAGTLAADEAGTSDGTVIGATWVPGVSGTALEFDGINDHVAIANTAALDITGTQITMVGWIYPHDGGTAGGSRVISKRTDAGGSDVYSMYTYQSRLRFRLDGQDMISAHVFALNQWLHVAMVYDGVDKRIYVDGVLDAATPQLKSDPINASTRAVHLGMREAEARRYNGFLDEVRIYDTALSAAEVNALFDALQPPPSP